MTVDLHIHTVASGDGEFAPREIIERAKEAKLHAIAITDHDSVASLEEAIHWGEKAGIEVIPGCEFSASYKDKWFHILGYFIDDCHPGILEWCRRIDKARQDNVDAQIAKLREGGFYLDKDKVLEIGTQPMPICYGGAIFADSRNDHNQLLKPYRLLDNPVLRFCLDWIVTGRPYNSPQYIPGVNEAVDCIVQCGGVPVLAHPAATLSLTDTILLKELLELGIVGVEAFTTWHTKEQEDYYFQFCQEKGILATSGSDFHGKSKPHIRIGQARNNSYDIVRRLKELRSRQ